MLKIGTVMKMINECIAFGVNVIPPCNFIDDGSCIVYGCSDPLADNYWDEATNVKMELVIIAVITQNLY